MCLKSKKNKKNKIKTGAESICSTNNLIFASFLCVFIEIEILFVFFEIFDFRFWISIRKKSIIIIFDVNKISKSSIFRGGIVGWLAGCSYGVPRLFYQYFITSALIRDVCLHIFIKNLFYRLRFLLHNLVITYKL